MLTAIAFLLASSQLATPPEDRFAALAPLVGHCWIAEMGNGFTDKQCYKELYSGALIHSEHVVSGGKTPYEGITVFSWDGTEKRLRYHYFTSTGAVSEGHAEMDGKELVMVESHVDPAGKRTDLRNAFVVVSPDEYRVEPRSEHPGGPQGVRIYKRMQR